MPKRLPIIKLMEVVGSRNGITAPELPAALCAKIHPASLRRGLTRLKAFRIVRARPFQSGPTGRPRLKWRLTELGYQVLDLLGPQDKRYGLGWREVGALAGGCVILARAGSLKPKARRQVPAWVKNRWLLA